MCVRSLRLLREFLLSFILQCWWGHVHWPYFSKKFIRASMKASIASMQASTASSEAFNVYMQAFMEAVEAFMEVLKLPWRQWQLPWKKSCFHGTFHIFFLGRVRASKVVSTEAFTKAFTESFVEESN